MTTGTILIIVLIVILLGGGLSYGPRAEWSSPQYGGLGLVIVILIILLVLGRL